MEVLVHSILRFDSAEEILDSVPLHIQFKLAQLIPVLTREALGQEHVKKLLSALLLAFLYIYDNFHGVLVTVLFHAFEVFADLVILTKT